MPVTFGNRAALSSLLVALTVALGSGACVTGTAHRLPLAGNPLREQASSCEAACRRATQPIASGDCDVGSACNRGQPAPSRRDDDTYAACLDTCPGATAIDGASCPDPPTADVICLETSKPNPGAIAGGTVAVASGLTVVLIVAAIASLPVWVIIIAIAAS